MRLIFKFLFFAVLSSYACNHKYYAPNKINTPLLSDVGESQASVGFYTADEFSGINLQGTYRPMTNMVLGANFFTANSGETTTSSDGAPNWGKGIFGELSIGPYFQVNENMAFSILMGGGFGRTRHKYGFDKFATLNFQRQFIQPSFKFRRKHFSFGSGIRLCRLDYTGGDVNAAIDREELNTILDIDNKSPFYLPELGLNIGFVGKHITVEYSITNLLYQNNYHYRFADRTIGLDFVINPATLWKSLSKKKR